MPPKSIKGQRTITDMFADAAASAPQRQPNLLSATQGAQLGTSEVSLSPPHSSEASAASIPRGDPTILARILAAEETGRMEEKGLLNQASYLSFLDPNDTMHLPLSQDAQDEVYRNYQLEQQREQQRQQQRQQDALAVQQILDAKQSRANARAAQEQEDNPGVQTQFEARLSPGGGAGLRGRINKTNFFTFKGRRKSKKSKSKRNKVQKKKTRRSRRLVK